MPQMLLLERHLLIQLGLAILLGGAIGLERELRGRAAGLRTMILVCMGSALAMIVSGRMTVFFGGEGGELVRVDPGRIAAGIVTGIGFLGAGVIVKLGDVIRGVTTAAAIWFVAALGLALGDRQYALAIYSTVFALCVLVLLQLLERFLRSHIYRIISVTSSGERASEVNQAVQQLFSSEKMRIMDLKATSNVERQRTQLTWHVRTDQNFQAQRIVQQIGAIDGVLMVEWQ